MDLDDLKKVQICRLCDTLYYTETEIHFVQQRVCPRCLEEGCDD
jgi:hypothetical protein